MPKTRVTIAAPSKTLSGYIIQLAFVDKAEARRWAETIERRGYSVSVTEAGGTGSVRVRVGNFSVREEADRQLASMKQEGLTGIVINLPQAYRPDAHAPGYDKAGAQ
jgi:cell division septation protein DedD